MELTNKFLKEGKILNNSGITLIVILLVPIAFQVFLLAVKQDKRHKEVIEALRKIEEKMGA